MCSTVNLALVTSIGADRVIDYTKEDFTRTAEAYDIIFDTVGQASFAKCENALKPGGRLLLVAAGLAQVLDAAWGSKPDGKKVLAGHVRNGVKHLVFLKQLIEAGQFKPVIDQRFPLEQIAEAHARVGTRRKRGSVVIAVSSND